MECIFSKKHPLSAILISPVIAKVQQKTGLGSLIVNKLLCGPFCIGHNHKLLAKSNLEEIEDLSCFHTIIDTHLVLLNEYIMHFSNNFSIKNAFEMWIWRKSLRTVCVNNENAYKKILICITFLFENNKLKKKKSFF